MGRRKVGDLQVVNELTGEITTHRSLYSNRYFESFFMVRTTNGLDWFIALGKNEKSLFFMLSEWSNYSDLSVYLSNYRREYICGKLGIKRRQLSVLLGNLLKSDCIRRISQNDFLVNPEYLFKSSASELRNKIDVYLQVKRD